jgi:hypothetical protein
VAWYDDLFNSFTSPQQSVAPSANSPFMAALAQFAASRAAANAQPAGPGGRPPISPSAGLPYDARQEDAGQHEGTLPGRTNAGTPSNSPVAMGRGRDTGVVNGPPAPGAAGPVAQSGPPVGANGQAQSGGLAGDPVGANDMRYPTNNPQFALQSALQARGQNPFRANPYMSLLMERAPGLAQAFMMNNIGTTAEGMASQGGEGNMFGQYLTSLLGQTGGTTNALSSAMSNTPNILQQITAMQDSLNASGGSFQGTNPFAYALAQIYGNPQSAAGAYGALGVPFMSQGVGQAFTRGLGDVAGQAVRRNASQVEQGGELPNFWEYLFPNL